MPAMLEGKGEDDVVEDELRAVSVNRHIADVLQVEDDMLHARSDVDGPDIPLVAALLAEMVDALFEGEQSSRLQFFHSLPHKGRGVFLCP